MEAVALGGRPVDKTPPSPHPIRSGYVQPRRNTNQQQRKPYNYVFCTICYGRHIEFQCPHCGPT